MRGWTALAVTFQHLQGVKQGNWRSELLSLRQTDIQPYHYGIYFIFYFLTHQDP